MTTFLTILIEAVIVGIALIFIALLVNKLDFLPHITKNKMIDGIFYTGFATHLIFEISGINMWYAQRKVYS